MIKAKQATLIAIVIALIVALFFVDPIAQDPNYHNFVDTRPLFGIPNAGDVLSNLGFLIVGVIGLVTGLRQPFAGGFANLGHVYLAFFLGISLTAFGSSYYHWSPDNASLVWDRLPMTIAFMALFTLVIGEQLSEELALTVFGPLIVFGVFSVAYWYFTEQKGMGDLRLYGLVQFIPVLLIPLMLLLFPSPFTTTLPVWIAIGFYILAKMCELLDREIYQLQLGVSGHSIKHLLAAAGAASILWGLLTRKPVENYTSR